MILDKELTEPLLEWVLSKDNRDRFGNIMPSHHTKGIPWGCRYLHQPSPALLSSGFPYMNMVEIADLMLDHYSLCHNTEIEPNYGYLLSYSEEGHQVHPHRDANYYGDGPDPTLREVRPKHWIGGVLHCRLNVLISKSEEGGNPIINDEEIAVKENEVWLCIAGAHTHSTTEEVGKKPRIILSLGYFIPTDVVESRGWLSEVIKNSS